MPEYEHAANGDPDQIPTEEVVLPLTDHTWRLPQVDHDGQRADDADGWKITTEFSDNEGQLWVMLAREEGDGSVERTEALPLEMLEQYQLSGKKSESTAAPEADDSDLIDPHRRRIIDMIKRVPGYDERQAEGQAYEQSLDESRREKLLGAQGIIKANGGTHPQSMNALNRPGKHRLGRSADNA